MPNTAPVVPPGTAGSVPLTTQSGQPTFLNQANQLASMYWNSLGMSPSNPTGNLSGAPGIQNATAPALSPGSYATSGYMQNASISNPAPASNQPIQPSGPMNPFSGKSPMGGGGSQATGPFSFGGGPAGGAFAGGPMLASTGPSMQPAMGGK